MGLLHAASLLVAPPLCAACGCSCRAEAVICTRCPRTLAAAPPILSGGPQGIDRVWSSASHEGVARSLVGALKFRRLLPVAGLMADRIHWLAPGHLLGGTRRPGPLRAAEAAEAAASTRPASSPRPWPRTRRRPLPCLARRGLDHQVGHGRADRISRPPQIESIAESARSVLLVDDVLTTGATLTSWLWPSGGRERSESWR